MGSNSTKAYANRMRKAYGEMYSECCRDCCNCQLQIRGKDEKVCIAYGMEFVWDPSEKACGLFNIPFRGIRPKRRTVSEFYNKKHKKESANGVKQFSLF